MDLWALLNSVSRRSKSESASSPTKLSTIEDSQVEYHLLRSCFGAPKFTYVTRTCDPADSFIHFQEFDRAQCRALANITGIPLTTQDPRWLLASLPVSRGGLGIRSAADHSSAAFIASVAQTRPIVLQLLGEDTTSLRNNNTAMQMFAAATAGCVETLLPDDVGACPSQKQLSMAIDEMKANSISGARPAYDL